MPEMEKWLIPLGWTYNHGNKLWTDTHTGSTVWCRSYYRPGTRDATHNPLEGLNVTSGVCLIDECQTLTSEVAHKALGRLRSGPSPIMILVGLTCDRCVVVQVSRGGKLSAALLLIICQSRQSKRRMV